MSLVYVLCTFALSGLTAQAQDFTGDEVKAALVGHIIKNIEWPETAQRSHVLIYVYKDASSRDMLANLESVSINGKAIKVSLVEKLNNNMLANIVYVAKSYRNDLSEIVAVLRNTNTLIVTEESRSLHNVMINIVESSTEQDNRRRFDFQINRPNITFEQLKIMPDIVLFGGSELDVAELYRQTEQAIQLLRNENERVFDQLQDQQTLLTQKEQALMVLEKESVSLAEMLELQQQELRNAQEQYQQLSERAKQANEKLLTAVELAERKEQELEEAEILYAEQQLAVKEQSAVLDRLNENITENEALLRQQSSKLQQKELEVVYQAQLIEKQNQVIWIVSALVVIASLVTFFIVKLFLRNRRINNELQDAVTRLEKTQTQLVESEKMASLGSLVAGVAHELNTPLGISLTAITTIGDDANHFEQLIDEEQLKKSDLVNFIGKLKELDKLIRSNLERCHKLIHSFKQISSDQVIAENRQILLKDYVTEIMSTLSVLLKHHQVTCDVSGDNPLVNIDPSILNQVMNNLTTNAVGHAFDNILDKRIGIEIACQTTTAQLVFSDNGIGMDAQTQSKIFEPFFTTKRGRGGTGLGMNIVHNLVTTKLGGEIRIDSQQGKGTRFVISFPLGE